MRMSERAPKNDNGVNYTSFEECFEGGGRSKRPAWAGNSGFQPLSPTRLLFSGVQLSSQGLFFDRLIPSTPQFQALLRVSVAYLRFTGTTTTPGSPCCISVKTARIVHCAAQSKARRMRRPSAPERVFLGQQCWKVTEYFGTPELPGRMGTGAPEILKSHSSDGICFSRDGPRYLTLLKLISQRNSCAEDSGNEATREDR